MTTIPAIWLFSADIMSQLGGGFRQQRWCEYILAHGQPIRLFAVEGVFRVRFADVASVGELRQKRAEWIAASPPRAGVRDSRLARLGRLFKHIFLIDLFLPAMVRLLLLAHKMLSLTPGKVVLLCSSPPFGMGVVGRILGVLHPDRIRLVLDMRDLWSLHSAFPGPKAHKRAIEGWVIRGSDLFHTVAPSLAQRFDAQFGRRPEVVYNIATQVTVTESQAGSFDWPSLHADLQADSTKIVYTGSIPAGFYDLDGFLNAVELYSTRASGPDLQFVFVGAAGELAALAARRNLPTELLVFAQQVPHAAIAEIQSAADVLMFLGYLADDNQGQVSIKLFEYFRRHRPILPIHIREGSDVDQLIRDYCGTNLNLLSKEDVAETLCKIAGGDISRLPCTTNSDTVDARFLLAYSTEAEKIIRLLGPDHD